MPADISARIGIDGEKAFRESLNAINSQLKNLDSEMKAVVSQFTDVEDSEQAAAAKGDVLQRSVAATAAKISLLVAQSQRARNKLDDLGAELERVSKEFGENSQEAIKAQNAHNRQVTAVNKLESQINGTKSNLNKMQKEMRDTGTSAEKMGNELVEAGNDAQKMGSSLKQAFVGGAVAGAIQSLISGVSGLIESTTEYRKILGTLEISSQKAGYTAEETSKTYKQLYGVIGDTQQAATATANLQALGLSQEQLTQLTNGAIGAWATYGDSIPIDGLAEAVNETVKVGQVTGSFADVLNWAGTSEDEFNARLAAVSDPAERANIVLQELANQGLMQAGEAWRENNADIVQANLATEQMNQTTARLAEMLSPIASKAKMAFAGLLSGVMDVIDAFRDGGFEAALDVAYNGVSGFVNEIKSKIPEMLSNGTEMMTGLIKGIADKLPELVDSASKLMTEFLNFLTDSLPDIIKKGAEMLGSLARGIIDAIPELVSRLPEIIRAVTGFVAENLPAVVSAGVSITGSIIKGIISNIPELVASLPQLISAIAGGIGDLLGSVVEAGREIVRGLWNGISDMGSWIAQKIRGFGNNVLQSIKDFFGIHSPSTVMREEVGKMLGLGIGEGLTGTFPKIKSQIQGLSGSITAGMQNINAPSAVSGPGSSYGRGYGGETYEALTIDIPVYLDGEVIYKNQQKVSRRHGAKLVLGGA